MGLFKDCGCGCNGKKQEQKFTISVISALTFFLIANPQTYILTRRLLGAGLASPNGSPTLMGLFIHSVVFLLVVWAMMNIRQEKYEAPSPAKKAVRSPAPQRARARAPAPAPAPASQGEEEQGPSPAAERGPAPEIAFMDLEDVDGFDLEGASIGAGPAPMGHKSMTCGCPDGTTVQVPRKH